MKAFISLVISLMLGSAAFANDFAAALGFRSHSADPETTGPSITAKSGLGGGVIGFFDVGANFQIRSGFLYNQRNVTSSSGTPAVDTDLNAAYIDIPVTGMYRFAEYGGAFAGPVLGVLASHECKTSTGSCTGAKSPSSTLVGLQFGVSFKFAPQLGGEFYYEMVPATYWPDALKNSRTVGANLLFTFE